MDKIRIVGIILWLCSNASPLFSQTFEPGNKIKVIVTATTQRDSSAQLRYSYIVTSLPQSQQKVWQFYIISRVPRINITHSHNPARWKLGLPEENSIVELRWGTPGGNEILPGKSLSGFQFDANGLPGVIDYYSEGYAPPPAWPGDVEEESIPGYDDLTPYGPGIVGKTIGPVNPPSPFVPLDFLDTLISYKHQSVTLGWLKEDKTHKQDCDEIMNGRDWYKKGDFEKFGKWNPANDWDFDHDWNNGIVSVLDKRLGKARDDLAKKDSVKARRDLQIFVMEVELLNSLSKKLEDRKQNPIMTSKAYALLKYNAEYLIDKLPEGRGKK
ncbi:MAG TPA: hypothetical protein VLX91_08930 [Candidatus Acidoferrales bacterium]|nr:hypothetical protein [Candidatus Acidoferrales bacterium]